MSALLLKEEGNRDVNELLFLVGLGDFCLFVSYL